MSAAQANAGLARRFSLRFGPGALLASSPALSTDAGSVTIFPNPAHARFTVLVPDGQEPPDGV